MATKPTSPMDATGRAAEEAAKKTAKEKQRRSEEMALATAVEAELNETAVFDPKHPEAPILLDEIEEVGTVLRKGNEDMVVIRTHHDIEDMTFGVAGGTPQNYTFIAGRKYSVPRHLAAYLEGLGYVWTAS